MRWNRSAALVVLLPAILSWSLPASVAAAEPAPASVPMSAAAATVVAATAFASAGIHATAATASATRHVPARGVATKAGVTGAATAATWHRVISDSFNGSKVPSHWFKYNGPYGSGPKNCARPGHAYTSKGNLRLLMRWAPSGRCGAGWYTGGMMVDKAFGGVDQRITLRFKVERHGVGSHLVIPMRWPDSVPWPQGGEEDFCETDSIKSCSTFLHYSSSNHQIDRRHTINLARWHTVRFERRNHVVKVFVDDMSHAIWTYSGSSATLPDTLKRTVLQQECQSSCPSGRTGWEVIKIDWIKIDTYS